MLLFSNQLLLRQVLLATMFFFAMVFSASATAQALKGRYAVDYYRSSSDSEISREVNSTNIHHTPLAERYVRERDWIGAMRELDLILNKRIPNHPRALSLLLEVHRSKPVSGIEGFFQRAEEINPEAPDTLVLYGIYLHSVGKYSTAIEKYRKAIDLDPTNRNSYYNLGLALIEARDFVGANSAAQSAYGYGHPLPGLKNRLVRLGKWKEFEGAQIQKPDAKSD